MVKNPPASSGDWVRKEKWQPTPKFFPGKFHRQKSLVGYSPWHHKQLDMTEVTEHASTGSKRQFS